MHHPRPRGLLPTFLATLAACSSAGGTAEQGDNPAGGSDDTSAALSVDAVGATNVQDWSPLTSGNWPNGLTADACNNANGPTCYDCLHLPTGTYARWYRVDTGSGYADDDWFGATLGQLTFTDWDDDGGTGLGTDGAYYAVDPVSACAPVYWLQGGG